ncbi:MAG: sensor histidine kinase N-terminal domain-containing protein [Rhodocyclales bacterium]|nr:sensor histidine kinase N-terminal domain-containing protein [Rhodocyclales bacterium]
MKSPSLQPHSLRHLLLAWLLPGVTLLLVASGTSAYFVASGNANQAYDRSLLNLALALANQVQVENGHPTLDLQPQGRQILVTDKFDRIHFAVYGPQGELLAGEEGIALEDAPSLFQSAVPGRLPTDIASPDANADGTLFFDSRIKGQAVRGVILLTRKDGCELTALVAETLAKRQSQVGEILLSIIVPEFLLSAATIALIMFGVNSGLRPLDALRRQLARRSPIDLRPIGADNLPTELQPLATEIDRLLQRLDVALGAQRHFVSDAAHQLRTPIAALQAQVESALQERNEPRLASILTAVQRLARLVNQLLALARAEPGGMPLMRPVALQALIHENADTWMQLAVERDIDLGFELQEATVSGTSILLRELVGNLVDNAIRYTPVGGQVTVRCRPEAEGGALLVVEDSGPGIPPALRERVFERFFRGRGDTSDGCGLGLAIVRQIAEQHGARIRIGEAVAGGALVEVGFPACLPD